MTKEESERNMLSLQKKLEPAVKYNIGGTTELGKFVDVVEFCHPLGPEIVRDRSNSKWMQRAKKN